MNINSANSAIGEDVLSVRALAKQRWRAVQQAERLSAEMRRREAEAKKQAAAEKRKRGGIFGFFRSRKDN